MSTVTFDSAISPTVTLTLENDVYRAVIDVEGLDPQRAVSAEESFLGIVSLNPPTVRVKARRSSLDTWRDLIDLAQRAVTAAATSTTGETGGPAGILLTYFRVAFGMRGALRLLGEDI